MNKLKFFSFIIIAVLTLVFVLPACKVAPTTTAETTAAAVETTAAAAAETTAAEAKVIYYVTPCLNSFYGWNIAQEAFLKSCKEMGYIGSVIGDNNSDPTTMVEYFTQGVEGGANGMVVCPISPTSYESIYKEAANKNIAIIETAIDSDYPEVISWIGTDSHNAGKFAGQKAVEETKGKANILISYTGPGAGNQEAWMAGFKEAIGQSPDMKIVTEVFTQSIADKAIEVISNALVAYPQIDFIWCVEGFSPTAAATAVKEKGMVGKIKILAIDKSPETVNYIKEGVIWATLDQGFEKWGTEPVKQFTNYWSGKPVERRIDSGLVFYDKNNIK